MCAGWNSVIIIIAGFNDTISVFTQEMSLRCSASFTSDEEMPSKTDAISGFGKYISIRCDAMTVLGDAKFISGREMVILGEETGFLIESAVNSINVFTHAFSNEIHRC